MFNGHADHVKELLADPPEAIARDIATVSKLDAVPTLLDVLCEVTGMRFAAVARVTEHSWTACAVRDEINFGVKPGAQLAVQTMLCLESRRTFAPITVDHASLDFKYREHPTPRMYNIESYVTVPIVLSDGRYFGNLCALDPAPAKVSDQKIVGMFTRFAGLIATQLEGELARQRAYTALQSERDASELREQFIAILGHDLRNPLHAISATSTLIGRQATDPVLAGMASRIKANAKRMSSLIDDVLDFARGRLGGGIGIQLTEVDDLAGGLNAVVKELQDAQPNRQILTNIHLPQKIRCDLGRMQQVASNLISNALTHGFAETPVRVSARADNGYLTFQVWNQGEPISEENIDKVFEPFWRRESSQHREGLGLGLHICSQIIRAHRGSLSVTSSREEGTTFTARMPLQTVSPPA